jgi:hypothetical protein
VVVVLWNCIATLVYMLLAAQGPVPVITVMVVVVMGLTMAVATMMA